MENSKHQQLKSNIEAHLDSPITLFSKLRNLIFGKKIPDIYTQITFYIGLVICLIFIAWNLLGYIALTNTKWIETEKGIDVRAFIYKRGIELGFEPESFHHILQQFQLIALFCWSFVFVGLVLLWRKIPYFIYITAGACIIYWLCMVFMLTFSYWKYDTTFFDKCAFFALLLFSTIHYFFLKKESRGDHTNFFGIDETE